MIKAVPFPWRRLAASMAAATLILMLWIAPPASAEVRTSDVILGSTIEQRNLASDQSPDIAANHAILLDGDGTVYFERSASDPAQIASVTKIMTAIVALEYDPSLSQTITVTEEAEAIGESSAGLMAGDTMDLRTALKAMLVASGNDAAESIATSLGHDMLAREGVTDADDDAAVARFVQAMNDKAAELGLTDTVYANPHGLDYDEYAGEMHSTAADVAAQVVYALDNEVFSEIVAMPTAEITINRGAQKIGMELESTNELLTTYEGAAGVKTGYTELAGACLAAVDRQGDQEWISVVLGSPDEATRFVDTSTLWDWAYQHKVDYPLINSTTAVEATIDGQSGSYPVVAEVAHSDWIDKTIKATVADPEQTIEVFDLNGNISQELECDTVTGSVQTGDKIGTITFKQRNEKVAEVDLIAAEDVAAPNFFEGIGIWWQRAFSGCTGQAQTAESVLVNTTPLLLDKRATAVNDQ